MRTFRQRSAYGSIMPVQLHQSALWAAHIQRLFDGFVERARNTFASSPDQGDGLTMQSPKHFVNCFVVIIFVYYIFCSADTQRSSRDYKVSVYGVCTHVAVIIDSRTVPRTRLQMLLEVRLPWLASPDFPSRWRRGTPPAPKRSARAMNRSIWCMS
jgi:hypothetical protein